jgi:galactosamine-6-phosphate isomerase
MQHPMMHHADHKPKQGMTLGMKDILQSKVILLILSGPGKEEAREVVLSGYITTRCPASFLWLHNQVHCLVLK